MPNHAKGIGAAVLVFVLVGIILPYLLGYFRPLAEKYVILPSSTEIWVAFLIFGVLFAAVEYLQNAYSKGNYPWLLGKLLSGAVSLGFFSYIFFYMLGYNPAGTEGLETTGLVLLIYLSIGLSYLYLFLDFFDARRSRPSPTPSAPSPSPQNP